MAMGCNESREKELREKERPPINLMFAVATPLPLHIYQEYAYPIRKSPTSSTGSLSPTSLSPTSLSPTSLSPTSLSPTSLSPTSLSPTSLSPTSKSVTTKSAATLRYNKLRAIAHYKFPMFNDFSRSVQGEILGHIEKELENAK
jgi:hypothetical protein